MSKLIGDPQFPLSTATLSKALQQQVEDMIRQFNTLVNLASSEDSSGSEPDSPTGDGNHPTTSLPVAAVQSFRIAAGTQALITSTENLTALTRRLKEVWLFGELETVGASKDVQARTEEVAREVIEGIVRKNEM